MRAGPINGFKSQMMICKITPSVNYNYWLKRLDTQLNEAPYENSIKVPKVVKQTTLGTSLINSPMSSFSLGGNG